jgi:hypothetical protein
MNTSYMHGCRDYLNKNMITCILISPVSVHVWRIQNWNQTFFK